MGRASQETLEAALAEGEALAGVLHALGPADWAKPTPDCPEWTVRDLTAHLVAQAEGTINPLLMLRRMRTGRHRFPGRTGLDAYTAQQIAEHAGEDGPALAQRFATLWPRAVTMMRRTPGFARAISADSGIPGAGRFTVGYFFDCILPRDLLMHRLDLSRALGTPLTHGDHEAHIVADVMRDLAAAWRGPAVTLRLTGPGGGTFALGTGNPAEATAQTVDYLRTLAGRNPSPAVEASGDESVVPALAAARVVF